MRTRKIIFRMDDICPEMDLKRFYIMKKIFDKYNIKPLIGIVPDNQDQTLKIDEPFNGFWTLMAGLIDEGWMIAMHGFQHVYDTNKKGLVNAKKIRKGYLSEFAGHSFQVQYDKIVNGKKMLKEHQIETDIFFAPSHSYDKNTIKALKKAGFRYVSDGRSSWGYKEHELIFIPCKRYGMDWKNDGIITICLHVNNMLEADFKRIEEYILINKDDIEDFKNILSADICKPYIIMKLEEVSFVFYTRYIRPLLSYLYKKIKRSKKGKI